MNYCLDPEAVIAINAEFIGAGGLLDRGKLCSALARPWQGYGGYLAHGTLAEQAAALLEGVALAHAFVDANKRTAWQCCTVFLAEHGFLLDVTTDDSADDLVVDLIQRRTDLNTVVEWLLDHQET